MKRIMSVLALVCAIVFVVFMITGMYLQGRKDYIEIEDGNFDKMMQLYNTGTYLKRTGAWMLPAALVFRGIAWLIPKKKA